MSMIDFTTAGTTQRSYLALPAGRKGPGVLVLHAWWGLTDFFKQTCDRLAQNGFTAFAPDLMQGQTADTIEQAEQLGKLRDEDLVQAAAAGALNFLQSHPAVEGDKFGAIGFSMGAAHAVLLDSIHPEAFVGIVLFYGGSDMDFSSSKTPYQLHFAEDDDWEPVEEVKKLASPNVELHVYPNAYHWFFEENKPEHFKAEAAELAWERLLSFLKHRL
jgi:carboxymethylenebutenolidase